MIVSLLVIIHCTHCTESRGVSYVVALSVLSFSAVLIVWDAGSVVEWWVFRCDCFKWVGGGRLMAGQVLAGLRRSVITPPLKVYTCFIIFKCFS